MSIETYCKKNYLKVLAIAILASLALVAVASASALLPQYNYWCTTQDLFGNPIHIYRIILVVV